MNSAIHIGLAQLPVVKGDIAHNLAQHVQMIEQSAASGADVLVFPELSLTGYELELAQTLALPRASKVFAALSHAAVRHNLVIIAGGFLQSPRGIKPTIGAVVCFADGAMTFYSKQTLHPGEATYCSEGSAPCCINVKGFRMALAICADFSAPEHARNACALGADVYIASALISERGYQADAQLLSGIAVAHKIPVLLSNHISKTGGWSACGNNGVWNARGELVFSSGSKDRCWVLCKISKGAVTATKHG